MMSMYESPCHGCQERQDGCHPGCQKYKRWTIINEMRKRREKRLSALKTSYISDGFEKTIRKAVKRRQEGRK